MYIRRVQFIYKCTEFLTVKYAAAISRQVMSWQDEVIKLAVPSGTVDSLCRVKE